MLLIINLLNQPTFQYDSAYFISFILQLSRYWQAIPFKKKYLASIDHINFQCPFFGLPICVYFGVLVLIGTLLIFDMFVCIDWIGIFTETYPFVCYQIICGMYPNWTYSFDLPEGLRTAVARMPFGCSYLLTLDHSFGWNKISLKFI